MPLSTVPASYQPRPPRVTLALSYSQGHPSQPLRTLYPGVGFLPVDALRSLDRGPPPTAPESWQPLPPENAPIPSVTSVRGLYAQGPPMYVASGGALPSTTPTCSAFGVISSSLGLNRGLPSQVITHVGGGQWVNEEAGNRDDRLSYHAYAPTVTLSTPFQYATDGATQNIAQLMRGRTRAPSRCLDNRRLRQNTSPIRSH